MKNLNSKIKERITDLEAITIGNRVTLSGRFAISAAIPTLAYTNWIECKDTAGAFIFFASIGGILYEIATEYFTDGGIKTNKIYQRTKKHIKTYGKLDERFVKELFKVKYQNKEEIVKIDLISDEHLCGYCEWQGVYLACKALGKIEEFEKIKEKYYNKKIPLI